MNYKIFCTSSSIALLLSGFIWMSACKPDVKKHSAVVKHQIEILAPDSSRLYIDRITRESILQAVDTASGSTDFIAYRIGFDNPVIEMDQKKVANRSKYFQYDMYHDWKVLLKGDSVTPVYFEPRVRVSRQTEEGVLVFEVPKGKVPDELIYNDSYGSWGIQKIKLNTL